MDRESLDIAFRRLPRLIKENIRIPLYICDRSLRFVHASQDWIERYAEFAPEPTFGVVRVAQPHMIVEDVIWSELFKMADAGSITEFDHSRIVDDQDVFERWKIKPMYEVGVARLVGYMITVDDLTLFKEAVIAEQAALAHALGEEMERRIRTEELAKVERRNSMVDQLTGAHNRRYYDEVMKKEANSDYSLLVIDADHFKKVNDTFGHSVGDTVLKELAVLLGAHVRLGDHFFRWGGEEFVIMLATIDHESVMHTAERIREMVEDCHFTTAGNITVSIGIAMSEKDDPDQVFARADEAVYKAKQTGRNKVVYKQKADVAQG